MDILQQPDSLIWEVIAQIFYKSDEIQGRMSCREMGPRSPIDAHTHTSGSSLPFPHCELTVFRSSSDGLVLC